MGAVAFRESEFVGPGGGFPDDFIEVEYGANFEVGALGAWYPGWSFGAYFTLTQSPSLIWLEGNGYALQKPPLPR